MPAGPFPATTMSVVIVLVTMAHFQRLSWRKNDIISIGRKAALFWRTINLPTRGQLRFAHQLVHAIERVHSIGGGPLVPRKKKKVTWPQAKAFSVHLLTASGSFLAFLSVVAASEQRWTSMFLWLGLALFVDGIDGPIARKLQVKEVLPNWSGDTLDNIIDYITYVLIPAFALYQRGFMGENLSFISAAIIVISSAIYYADTGMKTKEYFFRGFPVVWNMVVFTLFIVEPGEQAAFAVVVAIAILSFVPINFLHPVRVVRMRNINLPVFLVWCGFGGAGLLYNMDAPDWVKIGTAVTGGYLFCIGAVMQIFPKLGGPEEKAKLP
jgi:phosphatidylcholine synthase